MAWVGNGVELRSEALGYEEVENGEGDGDALSGFEDAVQEAIVWVFEVFDVSAEAELVKEDSVNDDAAFAWGDRLGDEFAASVCDGIELGANVSRFDFWVGDAAEHDRTGFELVVLGANELAELFAGIGVFDGAQDTFCV